ncbi:hypothetical protein [Gilvibacter sp.]|uniref:hypothetical protein n=1 Tax=Gilvibacter sp. TaxID=2729997 RepID=UPI003F4A37B8
MIQKIRTSRITKIVASYLSLQLIITLVQPMAMYAISSGPTQPEFNAFTPIGTSDMVNLSSGDFNYNIPIMDVGGYPINLAYDSGVTMDQEATWVGLGWNLNVGQINRSVRGIPDDFNGDEMRYENDMKENITIGSNFRIDGSLFGWPDDIGVGLGLGVQYNNYEGITFHPSYGVSFELSDNVQVGMNISTSTAGGATVSPNVKFTSKEQEIQDQDVKLNSSVGVSINSRQGFQNLTLSAGYSYEDSYKKDGKSENVKTGGGTSGSISFNNNHNYTPFKRAGTINGNYSFSAGLGSEVFGLEAQGTIQGYGSYQKIRSEERVKDIPAFGYNFTEYADGDNTVLDFTREKDQSFNKNTSVLPITNYTYDIYTIQGHGNGGMFRPHRGQIGYLYDNRVVDLGDGVSAGAEFGAGWNVHGGADVKFSSSYSSTGGWEERNFAKSRFEESDSDPNSRDYEPVYFKMVGETNVDQQPLLFSPSGIPENAPMDLALGGNRFVRSLEPSYRVKQYNPDGTAFYNNYSIGSKIKRNSRDLRNTALYTVSFGEAEDDGLVNFRPVSIGGVNQMKNHHMAGIKVLKPDGGTYVYGETAYNWSKEEITADVSGVDVNAGDNLNDDLLIVNNGNVNADKSDEYFNKTTTPAYAHSFLLSSVLSSDYEDLEDNGPTPDDLGSYTLFNYGSESEFTSHYTKTFAWKTPYENNRANYNEGLKSTLKDQKATIVRGSKELRYLHTIETKTHVAYFKISNREDGYEAGGSKQMKKIEKIFLFTRPEYIALGDVTTKSDAELSAAAIKTAHFEYDYSLCKDLPSNPGLTPGGIVNQGGKLTLKKVYFTYRGSNMGQFTPYNFNYSANNPDYGAKDQDIWGCYKPNAGGYAIGDDLNNPEFPFVEQDKTTADLYATSWMLESIDLPSGGKLEIEAESDDYTHVQDKKAMQMYKLHGFGRDKFPLANSDGFNRNETYGPLGHAKFMYVKISDEDLLDLPEGYDGAKFMADYLSENAYEPIYFRALLNMANLSQGSKYDYVSGYFDINPQGDGVINGDDFYVDSNASGTYVSIPMVLLDNEGGWITSNDVVNPVAKAGWYFGRSQLNRVSYSLSGADSNDNFESIVVELVGSLGQVFSIFSGPNTWLQNHNRSKRVITEKSWIRMENATKQKFGGGMRITKVQLQDNWNALDLNSGNDSNDLYRQFYGQEYDYTLSDGTSSGVATYEPNGSKENPFVQPFYANPGGSNDQLVAPRESNYVEKPLGESFFPSANITYARVTVKNLERTNGDLEVGRHATGRVVNEFYTSRDFPTKTDFTEINMQEDKTDPLGQILQLDVKNHLAFSQGFVVETNDMNGKQKSTRVYPEDSETAISGVDYTYNLTDEGDVSNTVRTIDKTGLIGSNQVGVSYDMYNDFRQNYSQSTTAGFDFNVAGFVIFIWPVIVPLPVPRLAEHENKLNTATTTKVIHRTGILTETTAFDLGSTVSTKNLAWDAHTGQVILTETINEFDDNYFSFNYPSHWVYDGMDMAINTINLEAQLSKGADAHLFTPASGDVEQFSNQFMVGDELQGYDQSNNAYRLWYAGVENVGESNESVLLMNPDGTFLNDICDPLELDIKVVRSAYRNMQLGSMASVTSMSNPLEQDFDGDDVYDEQITEEFFVLNEGEEDKVRIVNASAVEYSEAWPLQWEQGLPDFPDALVAAFDGITYDGTLGINVGPKEYGFNPYLYNARGRWQAKRSYAYLTGRRSLVTGTSSPRYEGFMTSFKPFYGPNAANTNWVIDDTNWTFASKVTQVSPFGAELENEDALGRFSSAQYGYNYTMPTAVASNSAYSQIGFDGFEDYDYSAEYDNTDLHFGLANNTNNIVSTTSHTGQYSLFVPSGETAELVVDNYTDSFVYTYPGPDDCGGSDPTGCGSIIEEGIGCIIPIGGCSIGVQATPAPYVTGVPGDPTAPVWANIEVWIDGGQLYTRYTCNPTCPDPSGPSGDTIDEYRVYFYKGGLLYFQDIRIKNSIC